MFLVSVCVQEEGQSLRKKEASLEKTIRDIRNLLKEKQVGKTGEGEQRALDDHGAWRQAGGRDPHRIEGSKEGLRRELTLLIAYRVGNRCAIGL